jgi:hypothetical protein
VEENMNRREMFGRLTGVAAAAAVQPMSVVLGARQDDEPPADDGAVFRFTNCDNVRIENVALEGGTLRKLEPKAGG